MKRVINGLDINYTLMGERRTSLPAGRQVLILHGWGSSSGKWQRAGELLAENGLKVIIPDLPGFGESEKPKTAWDLDDYCDFVREFVDFLNLDKFYLLGHSFGGALAVKCSLKFPEKIDKLFLVSAACIRRKSFKVKFLKIISKIFKIRPFFLRKLFYRKSDYLSVEGVMKETYLKIIAEDFSGVLSQVQVPTVIIWGERDDVVPLKNGYLIKQRIKNSKLVIIPGGDHDLEQKVPEKLTDVILTPPWRDSE